MHTTIVVVAIGAEGVPGPRRRLTMSVFQRLSHATLRLSPRTTLCPSPCSLLAAEVDYFSLASICHETAGPHTQPLAGLLPHV